MNSTSYLPPTRSLRALLLICLGDKFATARRARPIDPISVDLYPATRRATLSRDRSLGS